ncbi:MAG: hypothetical protein R6W71_08760 [Bacteroidales bacterium]|jgi:hypothetical protein
MKTLRIITGFIAILCLTACSSTSMIGSWSDPAAAEIRTDKVMVFGVTPRMDVRQNVENQMATMLKSKGVDITPSITVFPPGIKDAEIIEKELINNGYNMAIVISLFDSKEDTRYVQGTVTYAPGPYHYPFRGYMGYSYGQIYQPGYYETTTLYYLECNAYSLPEGKLVYSGQTKTVDPASLDKFSYDLASTLVKDMTQKGILPAK